MQTESAFEAEGICIEVDGKPLLSRVSFTVPSSGVTVLLGPGGTGKSVILRALGGRLASPGVSVRGVFRHRGAAVDPTREEPGVVHLAQPNGGAATDVFLDALREGVERALDAHADLLVDETADRLPEDARDIAAEILATTRGRAAAVVVTHDIALARSVADHVVLLAGGGVLATGAAPDFFDDPRDPLVERFLRQGNCWPAPEPPPLPSHFRFIVPGKLAGMGRPGLVGDVDADLEAIAHAGICTLVSLTEQPFPAERLRPFGIAPRHFPIADMGAPAVGPTMRLCGEIGRAMARGDAVAVHCHAGLGRTGTILAAQLIWGGASPAEAVTRVRSTGRGYIQSDAQFRFLERFADEVS